MRIVGGELRGRRFKAPVTKTTRPTSERVREALGSALHSRGWIEGRTVLDLFAGTGALAFEFLSRGAERAVLVDSDRRVVRALREAAQSLGVEDRTRILQADLLKGKRLASLADAGPYSLVFADPPYASAKHLPEVIRAIRDMLCSDAVVVLEHPSGERVDQGMDELGLACVTTYRYGDTALTLLSASDEEK